MNYLQPYLSKLKTIRNDEAGQSLIEEVAALGAVIIPEIVDILQHEDSNWELPKVLAKMGKASSSALLELFFDPYLTQFNFDRIVEAMRSVKDERFIGVLLPILYSHDDKRAEAAVKVLEHVNNLQVVNAMAAILGDKSSSPKLQAKALRLLGFCPSAGDTIPLIKPFRKNKQLKYLAILSLYRLGDDIELKTIKQLLEASQPKKFRYEFLSAIAKKQDKRLASFFLELLNEMTKKSRRAKKDALLMDALIYLVGEFKLENAVKDLAFCLEPKETYWEASQALMKIGNDAALEVLLDKIELWWDRNIGWEKVGDNEYECQMLVKSFGSRLFESIVKFYEKHKDAYYLPEIVVEVLCHLEDPRVADFFMNISTSPEGLKLIHLFMYKLRLSKDERLIELVRKLTPEEKPKYPKNTELRLPQESSFQNFDKEQEIENVYELWQKAEDEKSKETYFSQLAKLKDERIIPNLERLLYYHTERESPKESWALAWKLSRYPEEKVRGILADWFRSTPANNNKRWFMQNTLDFPDLTEFVLGREQGKHLFWLADALYSPNLYIVLTGVYWLPIASDKQRFIPLLLPMLHDTRRIDHYYERICDAVADRLKDYDILLARELYEAWQKLNK